MTSALQLEGEELRQIIRDNFRKGIKYKYLIPKDEKRLHKNMIDLAKEWQRDCAMSAQAAQDQIQCFLVPKHFAYMTVLVYDPYSESPTVLVKFPTSEVYEQGKYPLIYKVDEKPQKAWKDFVDSLQEMISDDCTCAHMGKLRIDFCDIPQNGEVRN
jgi:hypothetical protein